MSVACGEWLYALSLPDFRPMYKHKLPGKCVESVVLAGRNVLLCHSQSGPIVYCIDRGKGKALWTRADFAEDVTRLVKHKGRVLAVTDSGLIIELHGKTGRTVRKYCWPNVCASSIGVEEDAMYGASFRGYIEAVKFQSPE